MVMNCIFKNTPMLDAFHARRVRHARASAHRHRCRRDRLCCSTSCAASRTSPPSHTARRSTRARLDLAHALQLYLLKVLFLATALHAASKEQLREHGGPEAVAAVLASLTTQPVRGAGLRLVSPPQEGLDEAVLAVVGEVTVRCGARR